MGEALDLSIQRHDAGHHAEGQQVLERLVCDYPWCSAAYVLMAQHRIAHGDLDEATRLLVTSLTIRPAYPLAWTLLGDSLKARGCAREARTAYLVSERLGDPSRQ